MHVSVAPRQLFASELAAMNQVLEHMKLWIVDVSLALVAPNRKIRETQSERVIAGDAVQGTVLVDVTRAERSEAKQANPILDCCVALSAFAFVIDG